MRHTFQCHSSTPNFTYTCGISGCTQTLKTFSAILSHLGRKHSDCDFTQLEPVELTCTTSSLGVVDVANVEVSESELGSCSNHDADDAEIPSNIEELGSCFDDDDDNDAEMPSNHFQAQRSTALMLLTLKERHRLTQSAITFSVGQIKQVMLHIFEDIKLSIRHRLGDHEVNIDDCFDIDPFDGLETEYLQTKFYRKYFNLVVSSYFLSLLLHCCFKIIGASNY